MDEIGESRTLFYKLFAAIIVTSLIVGGGVFWLQEENFNKEKKTLEEQINNLQEQISKRETTNEAIPPMKAAIRADWQRYECKELNLVFSFPPLPGTTSSADCSIGQGGDGGMIFRWSVNRNDVDKDGWTYDFAGGVSKDFASGSDGWITFTYQWTEENGKYFREFLGTEKDEIIPLRIVPNANGTRAVIFNAWPTLSTLRGDPLNPKKIDKVAILNFPANHHEIFKSITFYFYDDIPLDDIVTVIKSVDFSK